MSGDAEFATSPLLGCVQEETPHVAIVHDMLNPESLPPGWTAQYNLSTGRREVRCVYVYMSMRVHLCVRSCVWWCSVH